METIAGVDGCKGGWLVAVTEEWPSSTPTLTLCRTFKEVIDTTASCSVTVIDIPIGLLNGKSERLCDTQAREALADRQIPNARSRVFRAPPRSALHVFDGGTREQQWPEFTNTVEQLTGKRPTKQTFDFSAKVKEVDDAMNPDWQQRILEFHPEPAWKRVARSTLRSKHTASGLLQRLNLLRELGATWVLGLVDHPSLREPKREPKLDDLLDALIGLTVAHDISRHSTPSERANELKKDLYLNRFPKGKPESDEEKQLRMEIWY